jgi:4-amino-4-deoxy-L-arabinose transferase-like glycosyltransferase
VAVAFALRAYDLGGNPPEFFEDELAGVVGAWSIATTGHDVERTWLPFIVTRLELKQPIYFLATVPLQALVGADVAAMRLPAALFGAASTALIVWLVRRVFGWDRAVAVLAGGLFAILPWAVHYARAAMEPAALIPFTVAGVGLLWSGLAERRPRATVAGAATLAIGAYTYHPALPVNAVLGATVVAIHARGLGRREMKALGGGAILAGAILAPYAIAFLTEPLFTEGLRAVNVFKDGIDPDTIGRAWRNYAEQWNPQWLFLESHFHLRNQPGVALLFPWLAPFLVLGIARAVRSLEAADAFLLSWAALGALPAAVTNDSPHFARGLLVLPPIAIFCARGLLWAWDAGFRHRRTAGLAIVLAWTVTVAATIQVNDAYRYYFEEYPITSRVWWYFGTSGAMRLVRELVPDHAVVCLQQPLPVSHYTFRHYVIYHLGGRALRVVEGIDDGVCRAQSSFVLHRASTSLGAKARAVAAANDERGRPIYVLSVLAGPNRLE